MPIKPPKQTPAKRLRTLLEIVAPSNHVKEEIKRLHLERRRLEESVCSMAWFDAVWERGEPYAPDTPCCCERCQGKRLWPGPHVYKSGVSFECAFEMSKKQKRRWIQEHSNKHYTASPNDHPKLPLIRIRLVDDGLDQAQQNYL